MRIYNVELIVTGAVTIPNTISFSTDKELNLGNIFESNITIKPHKKGLLISSTVYTADFDRANKVAILFIGKMLDILSLRINTPLSVSSSEAGQFFDRNPVKAVVSQAEIEHCFRHARTLNLNENKLLRAFSWYRKGQYTEDPFDKFLAYWNAISVIADGYCNDNERTRQGIINKIWDCFITLWGDVTINWPFINGDNQWVNTNNDIRNKIAHGGVTVDIQYVEDVVNRLPAVKNVAFEFLKQWSRHLNQPILD